MRSFLQKLRRADRGAAAAEYALILAIVAGAIAIAAFNLGAEVSIAVDDACDEVRSSNDGAAANCDATRTTRAPD